MFSIYCGIAGFAIVIVMIALIYQLNKLETLLLRK